MKPTLIALDAGTTGVTALLFDLELEPLARAYREFPQSFPQPGRVEHDAGEILAATDRVLEEVLSHPAAGAVQAIGITNQRETVFALERKSGRALRPGIVWQDRRTSARCEELRQEGRADEIQQRTGLLIDPYFSSTKIEWMLREDPALARRANAGEVLFATVDTLVLSHLTGQAVQATDFTNASRTMLFDLDRRAWDGELCELFGVDPSWLPEVRGSIASFGQTRPEKTGGRSIELHGVAGDQQAALFGQGCFDPGGFKVTYGTGSFLLLNTGERVSSSEGLITTLAVGRDGQPCFALEGSVFVSGAAVQWLRDQLGLISSAAEVESLAAQVPDSGGVFLVPAFAGLGAPYWDADARGALLGLTRGSSRAHVARAALEAIAFQNAELIEVLRQESGLEVRSLLADGGAAQNDLLLSIQADLAGVQVVRSTNVEATARGAALLAGLGKGLWQDPAEPAALHSEGSKFEGRLGPSDRSARLAAWRGAVARVRS